MYGHSDLAELIRLRPDIDRLIYRNVAAVLGENHKRSNLAAGPLLEPPPIG